jgi:hypothetical protein
LGNFEFLIIKFCISFGLGKGGLFPWALDEEKSRPLTLSIYLGRSYETSTAYFVGPSLSRRSGSYCHFPLE